MSIATGRQLVRSPSGVVHRFVEPPRSDGRCRFGAVELRARCGVVVAAVRLEEGSGERETMQEGWEFVIAQPVTCGMCKWLAEGKRGRNQP